MRRHISTRVSHIEIRRPHLSTTRLNFSPGEIAAAAIVLLFFFGTLYYYFSALKPEQDRLAKFQAQYELQQREINIMLKTPPADPPKDTVKDALESLSTFK